ncbi:MAG TPA: type IIL restriction-modification enzyme MmeI, partial [Enhygromyxa sp.]|nr:type IIL restriction-modification enzyme MmeI [Enhygromyxa sp.]
QLLGAAKRALERLRECRSAAERDDELIGAVLRLVFQLHAEGRGLVEPSVHELFERLRQQTDEPASAAQHRFGTSDGLPRVDDRTLLRVLDELLMIDGRRRCYRTLDVEQLGRVYEALIGDRERQQTASHYTPRSLTAPIVERTLAPLLAANPGSAQLLSLTICDPAMGSGAFLLEACRQLADRVVDAWTRERELDRLDRLDEDPVLLARRLVAQRCLFGVDKNPRAVELARRSLWLLCESRQLPLGFVDHALRCGDSLVGLSLAQIQAFHWRPNAAPCLTEQAVDRRRLIADLLLGAYFGADHDKPRERERVRRLQLVRAWLGSGRPATRTLLELQAELRLQVTPFHWPLEFPRLFAGPRAFVCNPPFLGGKRISTQLGARYLDYLALSFAGNQNADLCAYFLVQCQRLIDGDGTLGLIATNTIHQGDTRRTGLQAIVERGAIIYEARRARPWPGSASVTASVVHVAFGRAAEHVDGYRLDGREVARIDSHLTESPERPPPVALPGNRGCCYIGAYVLGSGFFVNDDQAAALIDECPATVEVLKPVLGGAELNRDPRQAPSRTIIDLGDATREAAAARWPAALALLERRVAPERARCRRRAYRELWWQFGERQASLYDLALPAIEHCHVRSSVSKHHAVARVSARIVFPHTVVVFAVASHSFFAVIQARIHEVWARLWCSSLEDRPRYTPSTCFETFAFPDIDPRATIPGLERIGRRLERARAKYMIDHDCGLTTTYNLLKDPERRDPELVRLRQLHEQLDHEVLAAYGWSDLEVPPFTSPTSENQRVASARFEAELLDRLFALNLRRASAG